MERSRCQCYVITFESSNFDLMEVTYEVWTSLSQQRIHGWVRQGRRTGFSIRLILTRPSPSRSGRFIVSSTTSTWVRPGSRHQPRTHSMRCSTNGNVKSSTLGTHGDATTRRLTMRESLWSQWHWKQRSMTSSSRTPSWAASEPLLWITSLASWLSLHLSSERRRSCRGFGSSPTWRGQTWKRSTITLERFNSPWCLLQRSCRTMATTSSMSKRATTERSRKETNAFLPWGISWQPSQRLRQVEDSLGYRLHQVDGRKSWGLVMEFGHQNHRDRGFQNGSRSQIQQCPHQGSPGSHQGHLLDHHLDTKHHHNHTHRRSHHRRKPDRHHHRHRRDRVHRHLKRRVRLDHHHHHRQHPSLRRSLCRDVRLLQRSMFHHWLLQMWSRIAECWRTTRALRWDQSWTPTWVPPTLSLPCRMSKDQWRMWRNRRGVNTSGGLPRTLAYASDLPTPEWLVNHPIRSATWNGWGSTTLRPSVGGWFIRTTISQLDPWRSWWRRTMMHGPLTAIMTNGNGVWCRASVEPLWTTHRWERKRMNWPESSDSARPSWSQTLTTSATPTQGERRTSNMGLMNWDMSSRSSTSTASRAWPEPRSSSTQWSTWSRAWCQTSRPRRMWPSIFGYHLHSSSQTPIHITCRSRGTTQRGSPRRSEASTSWRRDQSLCRSARTQDFMVSDQAFRTSPWTQPTSWGALVSWSQLMMGCGDWCMVMPATITWTTKTSRNDWESSPPWKSSCFDKGYYWCVPSMLKLQRDWMTWWRNLPWRSASTWNWWRTCSKNLYRSKLEQEAGYQTLRAQNPIAQVPLEVEEDHMLSMKKHHGLKPQSDRFFLSHQPTCTTCGSTSTMVEMRRFYVKGITMGMTMKSCQPITWDKTSTVERNVSLAEQARRWGTTNFGRQSTRERRLWKRRHGPEHSSTSCRNQAIR